MQVLLSSQQLSDIVDQLAGQLHKSHRDMNDVVFVGIQQGGVVLGNEIVSAIQKINPGQKVLYGRVSNAHVIVLARSVYTGKWFFM